MLSVLVRIMLVCFWFSLFGGTLILAAIRLYAGIKAKLPLKGLLILILTPCSIGYYRQFKEPSRLKTLYEILVVVFFLSTVIGSLFVFYTRYF
jgi:hypothetical protein